MEFITFVLAVFIFTALVLMVWLWHRLSQTTGHLDQEIDHLRQWQRDHLPIEQWATFLQASFQTLNTGIMLVDPELNCSFINPVAETLIGRKFYQARGKRYQQVLTFTDAEGKALNFIEDPVLTMYEEKTPKERQKLHMLVEGKAMPVEVSWLPVLDEGRNIRGGVIVIQDVARQQALEEMKVDFVSIVSHELRTPITAIKGYIDILLHEVSLDPEHAEFLRRVYVSNERQLETVESLLNLSRLERGTIPIHPKDFSIEELAAQIVSEVEPMAKGKGLELKFDYPRFALAKVVADPDRTREVLTNLCTNAIKYTDSGWVEVNIGQSATDITIAVHDSGPGIPPDVQEKLFAKFQRGENALTESKQGMGLGLYITRQFVELMGGKIWVESTVGNGSTFSFTLPLAK